MNAQNSPFFIACLSDFHFGIKKEFSTELRAKLPEDIRAFVKSKGGDRLHMALIGGDLFDRGPCDYSNSIRLVKDKEAAEITSWLCDLCAKNNLDSKNIVFTPGNHDVDLGAKQCKCWIEDPVTAHNLFDPPNFEDCLCSYRTYNQVLTDWGAKPYKGKEHFVYGIQPFEKFNIVVVGANSTWHCYKKENEGQPHENGNLFNGYVQLNETLADMASESLIIGLSHHGKSFHHLLDRYPFSSAHGGYYHFEEVCDLTVVGHAHPQKIEEPRYVDNEYWLTGSPFELQNGALFFREEKRETLSYCQILEVHTIGHGGGFHILQHLLLYNLSRFKAGEQDFIVRTFKYKIPPNRVGNIAYSGQSINAENLVDGKKILDNETTSSIFTFTYEDIKEKASIARKLLAESENYVPLGGGQILQNADGESIIPACDTLYCSKKYSDKNGLLRASLEEIIYINHVEQYGADAFEHAWERIRGNLRSFVKGPEWRLEDCLLERYNIVVVDSYFYLLENVGNKATLQKYLREMRLVQKRIVEDSSLFQFYQLGVFNIQFYHITKKEIEENRLLRNYNLEKTNPNYYEN